MKYGVAFTCLSWEKRAWNLGQYRRTAQGCVQCN